MLWKIQHQKEISIMNSCVSHSIGNHYQIKRKTVLNTNSITFFPNPKSISESVSNVVFLVAWSAWLLVVSKTLSLSHYHNNLRSLLPFSLHLLFANRLNIFRCSVRRHLQRIECKCRFENMLLLIKLSLLWMSASAFISYW